jgi:hypothetical protein
MGRAEGSGTPYALFEERMARGVPLLIIYDNNCHLHRYAMSRDPSLYFYTRFIIDRLHYVGHTYCNTGYCVELDAVLESLGVNTQVRVESAWCAATTPDGLIWFKCGT